MPASRYKIWSIGDPVGDGVSGSIHVGVAGVAKKNTENYPFVVANELICSYLAKSLLLSVPPGFLIEEGNETYFVSLNFNLAGVGLPPINPRRVIQGLPDETLGTILFDLWIVNQDRHESNISYLSSTNKMTIFDHGHALLCDNPNRLQEIGENFCLERHCLVPYLLNFEGLREWLKRIKQVPEFYIRKVVESAVDVGLTEEQKDNCTDFLLQRRKSLKKILKDNIQYFKSFENDLISQSELVD